MASTAADDLRRRFRLRAGAVALVVRLWAGLVFTRGASAAEPGPPREALEFFERSVRSVLIERCGACHSRQAEKLKGGLLLDTREDALKGGETGPAVVPGDLARSLLVAAIARTNADLAMPPKTPLAPAEREALERWVAMGAPWPPEAPPAQAKAGFDLEKRKAAHWCWQALSDPAPPVVKAAGWVRNPLDAFVLAKLESRGFRPAPPAARRALIRRATFDLTGLPPTPAEVEAFEQDAADGAFAKVVDRLLASPHFGERWARHWMDLVRYAESRGHEFDPDIPNAWQYRDYLVRAYNNDLPYDRFVREHIAGDLLPPRRSPSGANEAILGTGFWFLGEEAHSPVDIRQDEADRLDNRLDVMGKTFLALTLGCARCHDHKFDAISQRDYYALTGFLVSSSYRQARFETLEANGAVARELEALRHEGRPVLAAALREALRAVRGAVSPRLLAAAEASRGRPVEDVALRHGVGVDDVLRWRAALARAEVAAADPLHRFAMAVRGDSAGRGAPAPASVGIGSSNLVENFGAPGPHGWLQDGFSFGLQPVRPGELLPGPDAEHPVLGVAGLACAWRDPLWAGLKTTGPSREYGVLGGWERAEQTIKTREFRLGAPKLWYLVHGPGRAYAVVDSHLMVNGPLHGALLFEWAAPREGWAWVEHSLADYQGHRLHVEFSPVGDGGMGIAQVVQAEGRPPIPPELIPAEDGGGGSLEELAQALEARFGDALQNLGGDPGISPAPTGRLVLADWALKNLDLLCPPGCSDRRRLTSATESFFARQAVLASRIRKSSASAPAMFDGSGMDECVLARGSARRPGALAPRRFLEAVAGPAPLPIACGGGRLELADAMLSPGNPFTARVMANRAWQHLFGRGIVATVDNFGVLGLPPSHPELLDYLARRFSGPLRWSLKGLLRELMLSNSYQMASRTDDAKAEAEDPDNLLFHRMNLRRLEGEAIRDEILAVSGRLDPRLGGPSVPVYLTSFMEGRGRPAASGPLDGDGRRSLYVAVRRNFLSPMMLAFDTPIPFNAVGRRNVSNVPAQALELMNDPFVAAEARLWAERLPAEPVPQRVRRLYETAFGRPPTDGESADVAAFASAQAARLGAPGVDDPRVWADVCHVLFNVKEFVFLP